MDIKSIYEKFRSGVAINESAKSIKSAPAPKRTSIEEAIHLMNEEEHNRINESAKTSITEEGKSGINGLKEVFSGKPIVFEDDTKEDMDGTLVYSKDGGRENGGLLISGSEPFDIQDVWFEDDGSDPDFEEYEYSLEHNSDGVSFEDAVMIISDTFGVDIASNESAKESVRTRAASKVMESRNFDSKNSDIKESSNMIDYKGCRIFNLGGYFVVNSVASNPESWMLNSEGKAVPDGEETEFETLADAKAAVDKFAKSVNESAGDNRFKQNKRVRPKDLKESAKKVPSKRPRLLESEDTEEETDFSIEEASLIDNDLVLTVENGNGETITLTLKDVDFENGDAVYQLPVEATNDDDFEEDEEIEESSKK